VNAAKTSGYTGVYLKEGIVGAVTIFFVAVKGALDKGAPYYFLAIA